MLAQEISQQRTKDPDIVDNWQTNLDVPLIGLLERLGVEHGNAEFINAEFISGRGVLAFLKILRDMAQCILVCLGHDFLGIRTCI